MYKTWQPDADVIDPCDHSTHITSASWRLFLASRSVLLDSGLAMSRSGSAASVGPCKETSFSGHISKVAEAV